MSRQIQIKYDDVYVCKFLYSIICIACCCTEKNFYTAVWPHTGHRYKGNGVSERVNVRVRVNERAIAREKRDHHAHATDRQSFYVHCTHCTLGARREFRLSARTRQTVEDFVHLYYRSCNTASLHYIKIILA